VRHRIGQIVVVGLLTGPALLAGCTSTAPADEVQPPPPEESSKGGVDMYQCQIPLNEDILKAHLFEQIQHERDQAGLPPLVEDETLCLVAEEHACEMIEGEFFAHIDPYTDSNPGQRVTISGYEFILVGENLAAGQRRVSDVVHQWMASESHRAIILGEAWRETGIAVRAGGEHYVSWVQIFADPVDFDEQDYDELLASTP
jgi:uncharacterized protein YkwD